MADGNIGFRIDSDVAGALAGAQRVADANDKISLSLKGMGSVSDAMAQKIIRANESIEQRYLRLSTVASKAFDAGKISAETYDKEIRRLVGNMDNLEGEFADFKETAGDAFDEQRPQRMTLGIGKMAGATAAASAAAALVKQGWAEVEEAIRNAGQAVEEQRMGIGSLRQLADSPEEYKALREQAEQFYAAGATRSLDDGGKVVFSLDSAGLLDRESASMFRELGATGTIADLPTLAASVKTMSSAFGKDETGSAAQIVSKAFAASQFSPTSAESLLQYSALAGGTASAMGISDEETLAAMAISSTTFGSPERASTGLNAFLMKTGSMMGNAGMEEPKLQQSQDALAEANERLAAAREQAAQQDTPAARSLHDAQAKLLDLESTELSRRDGESEAAFGERSDKHQRRIADQEEAVRRRHADLERQHQDRARVVAKAESVAQQAAAEVERQQQLQGSWDAAKGTRKFEGMGIAEIVRSIESENYSIAELKELLGEEGLRTYFALQKNQGQLVEYTRSIGAANIDRSAVNRKLTLGDPITEAARLKAESEAQSNLELQNLAAREIIVENVMRRRTANSAKEVHPAFSWMVPAVDSLGDDFRWLVAGQWGREQGFASDMTPMEQSIVELLRKMDEGEAVNISKEQLEFLRQMNQKLDGVGTLPTTIQ